MKSINPCKSVIQTSYDMVETHGGDLKVKSKEGEVRPDDPVGMGSVFIVQLPLKE